MIYSGIKYVKCKMRDSRSTGRVQKKTNTHNSVKIQFIAIVIIGACTKYKI